MDKILTEQLEKLKEKKRIESILKSPKQISDEVRKELEEIDKKYGDKRKTRFGSSDNVEFNAEDFIVHEDVYIVLSQNGWIRKLKTLNDPSTLKFKENDQLLETTQCNTKDLLGIFTSRGIAYVAKAYNLPYTRSGFGEPIQSLFKFSDGEKVIGMIRLSAIPEEEKQKSAQRSLGFDDGEEYMVASANGFGFRFPISNLGETTRSGRKIMSLKNEDSMIGFAPVTQKYVFIATAIGKAVVITTEQVTQLTGSGKGVILMKPGESQLVGFKFIKLKDKVNLAFDSGKDKEITVKSVRLCNRGSQGVVIAKRKKIIKIT